MSTAIQLEKVSKRYRVGRSRTVVDLVASTIDSPALPFNGGVGLLLPPQSTIDVAIAAPAPPPFPPSAWRSLP